MVETGIYTDFKKRLKKWLKLVYIQILKRLKKWLKLVYIQILKRDLKSG